MEVKLFENIDFFNLVEQELNECGTVRLRVKGFSMQPLIRNGRDSVLLEKYDGHKLNYGDICLFRYRNNHILHRYKRDEGKYMIMQGDNVIAACEKCTVSDVVAVVRVVYHNGVETSPDTFKWYLITKMHRGYVRLRMIAGSVLRKVGLR